MDIAETNLSGVVCIDSYNFSPNPILSTTTDVCNCSSPVLSELSDIVDTDSVTNSINNGSTENLVMKDELTDTVEPVVDISNKKTNKSSDNAKTLKDIRMKYTKNVVIGSLNINTLVSKFDALTLIIKDLLDILVVVETKLDTSFPDEQFLIEGFKKPYRLDRNCHGGGLIVYVRSDIPSKELKKHNFSKKVEALFIEINLRKSKLLFVGTYHSTHPEYGLSDTDYFEQIGLALDVYSNYDKFLLAGDFNVQEDESSIQDFLQEFHAKNLVQEKTCFKSVNNPSCIDLFITNSCHNFQNTTTVSTGLSDFHKMKQF